MFRRKVQTLEALPGQTQAQLFAAVYSAKLAWDLLSMMKWVRRGCTAIMLAAMYVSYSHQAQYLVSRGMPIDAAWVVPGLLDALTAICVKVLATKAVRAAGRVTATFALIFTASVSGSINFLAQTILLVALVYVVCVLLIPLAEIVAAMATPDFGAMDAMERAVGAAAGIAPAVSTVDTVQTPQPAPEAATTAPEPVKRPRAPRKATSPPAARRRKTPPHTSPGGSGVQAKKTAAPVEAAAVSTSAVTVIDESVATTDTPVEVAASVDSHV